MIQKCIYLTTADDNIAETLSVELATSVAYKFESFKSGGHLFHLFVTYKTESERNDIEHIVNKHEGVNIRNVMFEKEYPVFVDNIEGGYDQQELFNLIEHLSEDSCFDEITEAWATCAAIANPDPNNQYHGMNTVVLGRRYAMFDEDGRKIKLALAPVRYISIL